MSSILLHLLPFHYCGNQTLKIIMFLKIKTLKCYVKNHLFSKLQGIFDSQKKCSCITLALQPPKEVIIKKKNSNDGFILFSPCNNVFTLKSWKRSSYFRFSLMCRKSVSWKYFIHLIHSTVLCKAKLSPMYKVYLYWEFEHLRK